MKVKKFNEQLDQKPHNVTQVEDMIGRIIRTGNKVGVYTRDDRLYVYFNDIQYMNTNANNLGVELVLQFLSGILIGVTHCKK